MYKDTVEKDNKQGKEWTIWESKERAYVGDPRHGAKNLDCILSNGEPEEPLTVFRQRNDTNKVDFKTLAWRPYIRIKVRQWTRTPNSPHVKGEGSKLSGANGRWHETDSRKELIRCGEL